MDTFYVDIEDTAGAEGTIEFDNLDEAISYAETVRSEGCTAQVWDCYGDFYD